MIQIDAIMGWGAGVAEMLLQSHDGALDLLPALPPLWRQGYIRGMKARGGFTVDISWENNALSSAVITSGRGGAFKVRYGSKEVEVKLAAGQAVTLDGKLEVQ